MSIIVRRAILVSCLGAATVSMFRQVPLQQLQLSYWGEGGKRGLAGYFHLPNSVVSAWCRGDAGQRLAHHMLSALYDNDITADDVLAFDMMLAKRAHLSVHAAGKVSVIETLLASYHEGLVQGLRPPLPESVVYTFAHLGAGFKQRIAGVLGAEVLTTGDKLAVNYMSTEHPHDAKKLTSYVVARQRRFFASGARRDYLQPLDIFDKKGRLKSLQALYIHEASADLHLPLENIYRLVHRAHMYIYTEYGIFPLHFFFRDVALPEEGLMMKIKKAIDSEPPLSPFTDGDVAGNLEKTAGLSLTAREIAGYRNKLGILSYTKRRKNAITTIVRNMIAAEDGLTPLLDTEIAEHLRRMGLLWSANEVRLLRQEIAIPPSRQRKNNAARQAIRALIEAEGTTTLSNQEIAQILATMGYIVDERMIRRHLNAMAVPSYRERRHTKR